jgi:hypothetical protein
MPVPDQASLALPPVPGEEERLYSDGGMGRDMERSASQRWHCCCPSHSSRSHEVKAHCMHACMHVARFFSTLALTQHDACWCCTRGL